MGRWSYYSAILLGTAFAYLARDLYDATIPPEPTWKYWTLVSLAAVGFGLACQLAMIGAQGAFAQVLPVPGGRSVRGGGAVGGGWLILLWFGLSCAGGLLYWESAGVTAWVALGAGQAALIVAAMVYIWAWPAAIRDFDTSNRILSAGEQFE